MAFEDDNVFFVPFMFIDITLKDDTWTYKITKIYQQILIFNVRVFLNQIGLIFDRLSFDQIQFGKK